MRNNPPKHLKWVFKALSVLIIVKVTVSIVANYTNYLPPHFDSDFLRGRQDYFFGTYQWVFYLHIFSGPLVLIMGLVLMSSKFRNQFPAWHQRIGKIQLSSVIFLVAPTGLWMSCYTANGIFAGIGFATLALLTGLTAIWGWRTAAQRNFIDHQGWMWRCYLLLCSAVILRLIGGAGTWIGVETPGFDPFAGWVSWITPLVVYELTRLIPKVGRVRKID